MSIAVKRILLITRNVQFAIDVKRALESLGEYTVTPVTEARNAIEQLRRKPHHLVLLDIENLAIAPAVMIDLIRARQGEIAIVLAPDIAAVHDLARRFRAQGVVDVPASTRSLIPILEGSLSDMYDAQPQTMRLPAVDVREDTVHIEAIVDDLLGDQPPPSYTLRRLQASYRLLHPDEDSGDAGAALDAVELVIESDDDGETIRYRHAGSQDYGESDSTGRTFGGEEDTPISGPGEQSTVRDLAHAVTKTITDTSAHATTVPARNAEDDLALGRVLREALDESASLDALSSLSLFDNLQSSDQRDTPQRPSWIKDSEKFVREPSFLRERLPPLDTVPPLEQTTAKSELDGTESRADTDAATREPVDGEAGGTTQNSADSANASSLLTRRINDPYLRQLAVTMTQMMTELTAAATVLTRDDALVAFSGDLSLEDFKSIRDTINDDWTAEPNRARLRFLAVTQTGKEFMVYSKGTIAGLTMTLIFAGNKPLSAINQQGDRMRNALALVPNDTGRLEDEAPTALSAEAQLDRSTAQTLAFVWLVSDPEIRLNEVVAKQLVFWLEVQLNGLGWIIHRLDVHQDFVYLLATVPVGTAPEYLVRDLMERSLRIACSEDKALPADLWADAYLVLQPGRDLQTRELGSFLQFARGEE